MAPETQTVSQQECQDPASGCFFSSVFLFIGNSHIHIPVLKPSYLNLIQLLPFSWPGLGLGEEVDPVEAVTRFLDTLEAEALLHLDTLITDQEAQDRVLLEDVQVTDTARLLMLGVNSVTVC